jgi:LCP family protein required for cell wall assembly
VLIGSAVLGVFLLLFGLVATAILWYGVGRIDQLQVPQLTVPGDVDGDGAADVAELTDVLNILVIGSDSREGLTPEELRALGTEAEDGQRTDTIMLVTLDPRRDEVAILSFPRDLLVTRCDGSRGRINAAYGIGEAGRSGGGPGCLVETIQGFSGIPINHFVQVNFAGFIGAVDAIGGVTMYLDEPIRDAFAGVDLPAGCVTMDGRTALGFVRVRRIDSDFGRIARQQRFIREVLREAVSVGTLVNPVRLFGLVDAAARSVETDSGLTLSKMRRIAFSFRDLTPERMETRTVPAVSRTINGVAYEVPKEEEAARLFQAFRDGSIFPEGLGLGPTAVTVADVPPVVVLNGAGVAGLAAAAQEVLERAGFAVSETGNADAFDFVATQVVYPTDRLEEAQLLAGALGGVGLVPGDPGSDLTVVVGRDFDPDAFAATSEPTVAPAPPPVPTEPQFIGATPSDVRC